VPGDRRVEAFDLTRRQVAAEQRDLSGAGVDDPVEPGEPVEGVAHDVDGDAVHRCQVAEMPLVRAGAPDDRKRSQGEHWGRPDGWTEGGQRHR
jgi:hypothetical protein